MIIKQQRYFWNSMIALGAVLFLSLSLMFIVWGQVNADEGFYLYAGKLVYAGHLPYRDFAFTQTPLLPYIYGMVQKVFFQSIYLGRVTSVFFSVITFIMSLIIAEKYGGKKATALTTLMCAAFTFGIYFNSITKTYSLTTFFFVAAFFILTSKLKQDLKLVLSTVVVLLATLTRLSAAFFALPIIFYAFFLSNTKNKLFIMALCFAAAGWMIMLALPNPEAVKWGLVTHHTSKWGDITQMERIKQVLDDRIPLLLVAFRGYVLLWVVLLALGFNRIITNIRRYPAASIITMGLILFAIPCVITPVTFPMEYFVPLIFASFPVAGVVYIKTHEKQKKVFKAVMNLVLLYGVVVTFSGGLFLFDTADGRLPVEEMKNVAGIISESSTGEDKIFLLEALTLAIESDRQPLPNMTMAQFSFYETDTKTADHLHLINGEMILSDINENVPKIIVLTNEDRLVLQESTLYDEIVSAIEKNYRLIYSAENFGQRSSHVDVYIRRRD